MFGRFPRSNAQANRLVVKLIVPEVSIPVVRYFSWRVSSHSLASGLSGLAVTAKVLVEIPFAFLASSTLVFVLPDNYKILSSNSPNVPQQLVRVRSRGLSLGEFLGEDSGCV